MAENTLLRLVQDRYEASRSGPNSCERNRDNIGIYRNARTSTLNKNATDEPDIVVNYQLVAVENLNSLMTDTPVSILVQAKTPEYDLDAEIYQNVIKNVEEQNKIEIQREMFQKNMLLFGTAVWRVGVEADEEEENLITIRNIDPTYIYADPLARGPEELDYVIELNFYSQQELKEKYPKFDPSKGDDSPIEDVDGDLSQYNNAESDRKKEKIVVYEMWSKKDPTGDGEHKFGYFTVATDHQVLYHTENEMSCGNPYVFAPCYSLPDRVYGTDLIKDLRPIQDEINYLYKRTSRIMQRTANPTILANSNTIDTEKLTNEDGQVVPTTSQDIDKAYKIIYPQTNVGQFMTLADKLEQIFNAISGVQDVSQGAINFESGDGPSGKSIELASLNSQTRLRQFVRNYKAAGGELGTKIVQLTHQFKTVEQVIKISGADGQSVQEVMEREMNEMLMQLNNAGAKTEEEIETGRKILEAEKGISLEKKVGDRVYLKYVGNRLGDPTRFQVSVTAGTDIPKTKIDIAATSERLMQAGLLDPATFMEAIDFPLREKALERNQAWQMFQQIQPMLPQLMQKMQQAQGMAQQGAPVEGAVPEADTGAAVPAPVPSETGIGGGNV